MQLASNQIDRLRTMNPRLFEKILIIVAGIVFLLSLTAAQSSRSYSSDDVAVQTIVQDWHHGEKLNAVMGDDNWIIKTPVYAIQDLVNPTNSRTKLFIEVLIFNSILFSGLIFFIRYFLKINTQRSKTTLALAYLPLAWFLGLTIAPLNDLFSQPSRITTFMNPDLRNAEIGIALFLLVLLHKYLTGKLTVFNRKFYAGLLLIFTGFFFYSDPYFVYILAIPSLALAVYLWTKVKISDRKALFCGLYICGAVVLSLCLNKLFNRLGYSTVNNIGRQFIDFNNLWQNFSFTILAEFKLFGANFWGETLRLNTLLELLNSTLLVLAIVGSVKAVCSKNKKFDALSVSLLFILAFNVLIFSMSITASPFSDRYLILSAFIEVILLAWFATSVINPRSRKLLILLFSMGVLINVCDNTRILMAHTLGHAVKPNAVNMQIIKQVEQNGLTKGYANYWDGNINTYLSNLKVHFLPVECRNQKLYKFPLAINKTSFDLPAKQTFYLFSNKADAPTINDCDQSVIDSTMMIHPTKKIVIDSNYTLYVYNMDIGNRMDSVKIGAQ